jgi:hypothetical protein
MTKEIKILGFNFTKLEARKKTDFEGKLEIGTNINISSVEKHKLDLVKDDVLKIGFDFIISYKDLGQVAVAGIMYLLVDSKTLKDAVKQWEDKKLPEDLRLTILNLILQKSSLKALELEEDLGLPLHMPMPRVSDQKPKK